MEQEIIGYIQHISNLDKSIGCEEGKTVKILFVNTCLVTGGISTAMLNYFETLKDVKGLQIDVIFLMEDKSALRYRIPSHVNEIELKNKYLYYFYNKKKGDWLYRTFMYVIKRFITKEKIIEKITRKYRLDENYDVAISFRNDEYAKEHSVVCHCEDFVLRHVNTNKKVAWIHNDPQQHGITCDVAKTKYKAFDFLVMVSKGCKESLDYIIPEYSNKIKVVYNPIDYKEIHHKIEEKNPYPECEGNTILVTVGRIYNRQKKMDRIPEIAKLLKVHNINNYKWYIVGDGEDFNMVKGKVDEYELSENVIMIGEQENPLVYMRFADCLVITSLFEGFSIVSMEALICNTPVITTNHKAAKELIKNGVNGFIVENDISSLYERIAYIIQNREKIEELRENIVDTLLSPDYVKQQFLELIEYEEKVGKKVRMINVEIS